VGINTITGFVFHQEAGKYLELARTLELYNWEEYFSKYKFYMTYVVYLKIAKIYLSNYQIVYLHIILLYVSSHLLYKILEKEYKDRQIAIVGKILFLFCYPVHFWSTSLYIEPFFIILLILMMYLVYNRSNVLLISIVSILFLFSRPNGPICLIFLLIFYYSNSLEFIKKYNSKLYVLALLFVVASILFIKVDSNFQLAAIMNKEALGLSTTTDASGLNVRDNLWNAYLLIINQIGYKSFAVLMGKKVFWYFNMTRPYYSKLHNVVYAFYMLYFVFGFLAIRSQLKNEKHRQLGKLIGALFISNLILIVLYQNEWHNRLNIISLPILCLSIAPYILSKVKNKYGKKLE
jgi:hypothetical protein